MKLIGYTVDLSFTNTPRVDARVSVPDPVTGEEKTETLHFVDDEARDLVAMVPNPAPGGTGLVSHPDGLVDGAKLRAKVDTRVAEMRGGAAAVTLAARVAAAEEARRVAHAAQAAKTKLDAEIAAARAVKAALDAEIATAKAAAAAKPAEPKRI